MRVIRALAFTAPAAALCGILVCAGSALAAPPMTTPVPAKPAATAPSAPSQAPVDPARLALAKEYMNAARPRSPQEMLDQTVRRMVNMAKLANPKLDAKKFEVQRRAVMMKKMTESLDMQARVIAQHYSLEELKGLVTFYKSPLGRKLVKETPLIMQQIMAERRNEMANASNMQTLQKVQSGQAAKNK
ncbi:MAG: DUF2059 domain-containing protein [Alphaproteobacteria bacterium]|nr:DUF2059 domain-containing protein [Alphaproteobacteria bacterium]